MAAAIAGAADAAQSPLPPCLPAFRTIRSGSQRPYSVRIGAALARSKEPLRKWIFAMFLKMMTLEGVSSMKLRRDFKAMQKNAKFVLHRIREAWANEQQSMYADSVEADQTYMGVRRRKMPHAKSEKMTGREHVGNTAVVGTKGREMNEVAAKVVESTDGLTLTALVETNVVETAMDYSDNSSTYGSVERDRESVNRPVGAYVRGLAYRDGIASF